MLWAMGAALLLAGCEASAPDNQPAANAATDEGTAAASASRTIIASFDCNRANGQAQELICADANLAAMDREAARLGGGDPAGQAAWARERDDCWRSDELRQCVMASTALRIHGLRQDRNAGADGISAGPAHYACTGISGPLLATFVNSDPGAVVLEWGGQAIAIDRVPTASGTRYDGRWNGQSYAFWDKGEEATLTVPGKGDLRCVETPAPA